MTYLRSWFCIFFFEEPLTDVAIFFFEREYREKIFKREKEKEEEEERKMEKVDEKKLL